MNSRPALTPRERVLAAIHHQLPDRLPFDLGSTDVTGIHMRALARVCAALGLNEPLALVDPLQGLAQVSAAVRERLAIDTVGIWLNPTLRPSDKGHVVDELGYGCGANGAWRMVRTGRVPTRAGRGSRPCFLRAPGPGGPGKAGRGRRAGATCLCAHGLCASCQFLGRALGAWSAAAGPAQFLMDLIGEPELAADILDRVLDYNIKLAERFLDKVGDKIQVIKISDDLGSQDNLLISPALYRRLIKPRQAQFVAALRAKTQARVLYHSCGAVSKLIDDFIEIGIDILNPVQPLAKGMETEALGKRYTGRIAFWGAVDNQGAISQGAAEAVTKDVRQRIRDLGVRGGYVIAASHNIVRTLARRMCWHCVGRSGRNATTV